MNRTTASKTYATAAGGELNDFTSEIASLGMLDTAFYASSTNGFTFANSASAASFSLKIDPSRCLSSTSNFCAFSLFYYTVCILTVICYSALLASFYAS